MCVECGKISINACVKKDLFSLTPSTTSHILIYDKKGHSYKERNGNERKKGNVVFAYAYFHNGEFKRNF